MTFNDFLSNKEKKYIYECLLIVVNNSIIEDWEFNTLLGVDRFQYEKLIDCWPHITFNKETKELLVQCINTILGYPWEKNKKWNDYISIGPEIIKTIMDKIIKSKTCDQLDG